MTYKMNSNPDHAIIKKKIKLLIAKYKSSLAHPGYKHLGHKYFKTTNDGIKFKNHKFKEQSQNIAENLVALEVWCLYTNIPHNYHFLSP